MSFLFKSSKEREKEARKERRRAFRQAEGAIDDLKDRIKQMDKSAAKTWEQAREAAKSGQKAAANRHLISYRASQVLMTKLEQKRWVSEQYIVKLEAANTDQQLSDAIAGITKVINIDPEKVADVFDTAQELLGEQVDSDRFWEKIYNKETEGVSGALEDHIPSLEEMAKQLEDEAAVEVGGKKSGIQDALGEQIQSGRDRLKKMMDGK